MSHVDHEWTREQLAAHLAGGLDAGERARLEAHMAACAECIAEFDELKRFDRNMDQLFQAARPEPGLEERVIHALREVPARASITPFRRFASAAAALLLLGLVGFGIVLAEEGGFEAESGYAPVAGVFKAMSPPKPSAAIPRRASKAWMEHDDESKDGGRGLSLGLQRNRSMDRPSEGLRLVEPMMPGTPPPPPSLAAAPPFGRPQAGEEEQLAVFRYKSDASGDPSRLERDAASLDKVAQLGEALQDGRKEAAGKKVLVVGAGGTAEKAKGELLKAQNAQMIAGLTDGDAGQAAVQEPPPVQRKIIRSGDVEFEIESFDSSVATISRIAEEEQGFVATVNSEKLPNGKVRGTVVVRVAPERLDTLLLKLRALGELKSQRIGSQDVTKQYYDLESRLRAARTMEERLLKIIKEGKGEIKDLLQAEKELGEWRTKIESFEVEIRYYNALISLSTLTVTLVEKEIKAPTGIVETERVNTGVEVEDVEKAHRELLAAIDELKGRVTRSEIKQPAPGRFNAMVHAEVAPDAAGTLRDRLKQIGNVARLEVDRIQEVEGGQGKAAGVSVRRKDTQFSISLYNLANVQPKEVLQLSLACADAEAAYRAVLERVEKAEGRILSSALNRQKNDQTSGTLSFEVKAAEADAVLADLKLVGEVVRLDLKENPDQQNVTRAKRGFGVQLFAMGLVQPRESSAISLVARDVPASHRALVEALRKLDARILQSQLQEQDRRNISAIVEFEVRREHEAAVAEALKAAGELLNRSSSRAQDQERMVDSKLRYSLSLSSLAALPVRETYTLSVETRAVDDAVKSLEAAVLEAGGRVADASHTRDAGRHGSRLALEVPLAKAKLVAAQVREFGQIRVFEISRNPAAPDGELAMARLDVSLTNQEQLLTPDSGPLARIRQGLSFSLTALSWSLSLVVIGLCFVVPISLVGWAGAKIARRVRKQAS
jgi:hypothetical protein